MRNLITGLLLLASASSMGAGNADCAGLAAGRFPDTVVDTTSNAPAQPGLPAYCEVTGTIADRIQFALRMPVEKWNGKFVVAGCGGFCGSLLPDKKGYSNSINEALKLGYAAITTDGGHEAPSWSTGWAMRDPIALELYAGAWMPKAVATGRAIVDSFYGASARRTYFSGCSNGGRLGLFAAQRYPDLFDAIAAGGGIFDLTGNAAVHGLWLLQSVRDENGKPTIERHKIPLLSEHVMQQCDALDGLDDGIVSRPDLCKPDLVALQCGEGQAEGCLSRLELRAIKRLYRGATAFGEPQFAGILPGSESLWPLWVVGSGDEAAWGERAAEGTLRLSYNIPWDQPFNPHAYKLGDELENLQRLASTLNATEPNLGAFAASGGKLLYYHGLADPLVLPGRAIRYYEEVVETMGAPALEEFGRFLFIPGHGHCWEKTGQVADEFNPLEVIDHWVESGTAPKRILALQKNGQGRVVRSRPLCPHPATAVFKGGDDTRAENYTCE
jgi:feruloyl esterase